MSTLADLYDPLTMPPALAKAHTELDRAVERCYRPAPFYSDRERVEFLFSLYEQISVPLVEGTKKKRSVNKIVKVKDNGPRRNGDRFPLTDSSEALSSSPTSKSAVDRILNAPKWFHKARERFENDAEDDAMDLVYDAVGEKCSSRQFPALEKEIETIVAIARHAPIPVLIGILTITIGRDDELPSRKALLKATAFRLSAVGEDPHSILKGL
jgi:hypothetical protein